jgi:hypothetical protein
MILVNGDSFTFGDELPDVKYAWPRLLEIDEVRNLARPGYSNDAIVKSTVIAIEGLSIKCAGAIIAWTTPNRIELNGQHLTPTSHRKYGSICDHVFLDWDEEWALAKFISQVCLLDSYLRDKGIPYLFVRTFDVPDVNKGVWAEGEIVEWMGDCPKGPGGHPLELGHKRIAKKINEHIRHLSWLP